MTARFGPTSEAWFRALRPAWEHPAVVDLQSFLAAEGTQHDVVPPPDDVFNAFDLVPPARVRVVILGQDPYPTPGHAHGLAFSYRGPGALPASLRNIRAEIERDLGRHLPENAGDLTPWARQGVLLLNTVLTTRAGEAGAHRRHGWEVVTNTALRVLGERPEPIVFLLWGRDARNRARLLPSHHVVLEAGHPSPLSVRHFRGCSHFSKANAQLDRPIDWTAIDRPGA